MRKLLLIPAAGVALIAAVLLLRRPPPAPPQERPALLPAPAVAAEPAKPPVEAAKPAEAPEAAEPSAPLDKDRAAEIKLFYDNYRKALVTEDKVLQEALLPALLRNRGHAMKLAKEDFQRSESAADREVSRRILDTLRKAK